jgi:hypothetical protein
VKALLVLALAITAASAYAKPPPAMQANIYSGYATPANILRGIARVESDERDKALGDDGLSRGRMQLNKRYDAERAAKWGHFDPFVAVDSVRIADCILMENLKLLGSWDAAITAYRWGVMGEKRNGIDRAYVDKVLKEGTR